MEIAEKNEVKELKNGLEKATKMAEGAMEEKDQLYKQLETEKGKVKRLEEDMEKMKRNNVVMQMAIEQEEEYISNTLLKKIAQLKKEKETLAMTVEQEEEYLTNTLQKKLNLVRQEKVELEQQLEVEQEFVVNRLQNELTKKKEETQTLLKKLNELKREKVVLEQSLEMEQECMVNRLQKRLNEMDAERRALKQQLLQSPRGSVEASEAERAELQRLRSLLAENEIKLRSLEDDRGQLQCENLHLRQRVQREQERIENLSKGITRMESAMEMEEELQFHMMQSKSVESISRRTEGGGSGRNRSVSISSTTSSMSGSHGKWWAKRSEPGTVQQSPHRLSIGSITLDGQLTSASAIFDYSSSVEGKDF